VNIRLALLLVVLGPAAWLLTTTTVLAAEAGTDKEIDAGLAAGEKDKPKPNQLDVTLAAGLAKVGNYPAALMAYQNLRDANDAHPIPAQVAGARLNLRFGDRETGAAVLDNVLQQHLGAAASLSVVELIALGDAATSLAPWDPKLYRRALDLYEQAIRVDASAVRAWVRMGDLLLDRYNGAEASEAYGKALALDKTNTEALFGIARVHHFNHSSRSLEAAQQVVQIDPEHVGARVLLSRLYLELEEYEKAEQQAKQALAVNPDAPEALAHLAAVYYLLDQQQAFDKAIRRTRRYPLNNADLYTTLAKIAARNRRYQDAVGFALLATRQDRSAWQAHAVAGMNRLRTGDTDAGRRSLETAFRGDPFDLWTKNTLDLLDKVDKFATATSENFVLVAPEREVQVLAPYLLPLAERAYEALARRYQHRPRGPIRIELYSRHEDFSVRTVGLAGVDILGVSFGPVVALDSPSSKAFGDFHWGSTLWHELAHTFHLSLSLARVPRWFSEGLAVHEEHAAETGWGATVTPEFLRAFHTGALPPVSGLNQAFLRPAYPEQMLYAYYQASLLMDMIVRDYGFVAINTMLRGYRVGKSTADLSRKVLDLELEELDQVFERYVRERYQQALAALFDDSKVAQAAAPQGEYIQLLKQAEAAQQEGALALAEERLLQAQRLFPEHAGPGSSYRSLASLYQQQGRDQEAIAQLETAVRIAAEDLEALLELAHLYETNDDLAAAAAALARSIMIEPFDPQVHTRLAALLEANEDWPAVIRERQAALALNPDDPIETRLQLARVYARIGDTTSARHELLQVLESAPLYDEALELLLELRSAGLSSPKS